MAAEKANDAQVIPQSGTPVVPQSVAPVSAQRKAPVILLPAAPVVYQPGSTIITQSAVRTQNGDKFKPAAVKQMFALSSLQLVAGIVCLICGVELKRLTDTFRKPYRFAFIYYGVWVGVLFAVGGAISFAAAKTNKKRMIVASMVLNILCSSLWSMMLVGFSATGLAISASYSKLSCRRITSSSGGSNYNYYYSSYGYYTRYATDYSSCNGSGTGRFLAVDGVMLILAILEFISAIWCAVLCCGVICRCCKSQEGTLVQYSAGQAMQGQQQMVACSAVPVTNYTYPAPYTAGYPAAQGYVGGVQQPPPAGGYVIPPQAMNYNPQIQQNPPAYQTPGTSYQPPAEAQPTKPGDNPPQVPSPQGE